MVSQGDLILLEVGCFLVLLGFTYIRCSYHTSITHFKKIACFIALMFLLTATCVEMGFVVVQDINVKPVLIYLIIHILLIIATIVNIGIINKKNKLEEEV